MSNAGEEPGAAQQVIGGIRVVFQDLLAPEIRAIRTELAHHTKQLDRHTQKLEEISQSMNSLNMKLTEVLTLLSFEKRLSDGEKALTMIESRRRTMQAPG